MVNVLIIVDGQKINQLISNQLLSPGTQQAPTNLGCEGDSNEYITFVTQNKADVKNPKNTETAILVNSGDTIRWSITTFNDNLDYSVYFYDGVFKPPSSVSQLSYIPIQNTAYIPSGLNPKGPIAEYQNRNYLTQATILSSAKEAIESLLSFTLIDNKNGEPIGFFTLDTSIHVIT